MSLFNRITTWAAGQILKSSDLNGEFNNLVNGLNNLDGATTSWTNVKAGSLNVTGTSITLNGVLTTNAAGYIIGTVVQTSQVTDTASTTSSGTSYTSTTTAASITPKATTHKIRISVTGAFANTSFNTANTYVSIFRGSTDLSDGSGFNFISSNAGNTTFQGPCSMVYLDNPATTSSTTYTVKIKSDTAAKALWNGSTGTAVILLEEIAF